MANRHVLLLLYLQSLFESYTVNKFAPQSKISHSFLFKHLDAVVASLLQLCYKLAFLNKNACLLFNFMLLYMYKLKR